MLNYPQPPVIPTPIYQTFDNFPTSPPHLFRLPIIRYSRVDKISNKNCVESGSNKFWLYRTNWLSDNFLTDLFYSETKSRWKSHSCTFFVVDEFFRTCMKLLLRKYDVKTFSNSGFFLRLFNKHSPHLLMHCSDLQLHKVIQIYTFSRPYFRYILFYKQKVYKSIEAKHH